MLAKLSFLLILFIPQVLAYKGSPNAKVGGLYKYNLRSQPSTLNPLSGSDLYTRRTVEFVHEYLGERNLDTYEWEPVLATDWSVSKDGLTFDFTIREGVKWHDGKPMTIDDVIFSFNAIVDKENKYGTAHLRPYYENIKECKALEKNKMRCVAKKKYFGNMNVLMGLRVVPKHIYENPSDKVKKTLNKTLVGTGPYKFRKWTRGKHITLERNKDWWGFTTGEKKGRYNFDKMMLRFVSDGTASLQYLLKGNIDLVYLNAEEYVKKAKGKKWGKDVHKVEYSNIKPKSYGFIGWNLKNDLFKSKNVRKALYHLVDRPQMIKKFLYGYAVPATGPWYRQSMYADPNVKPIEFSPKKAMDLLKKEGWSDTDGDGVLDKVINGNKRDFSFTILEPNKEFRKYLVIFQQDAKKVGIDIKIKLIDWTSFLKLLDERKFEAVRLGWGGGAVDLDPKQIWHSSSYANKGSNFIGYQSKKVDQLIDKARVTLEREKRIPMMQEVYRTIAADYPYAFLFNTTKNFYAHTKRMKFEKKTHKYEIGDLQGFWWMEK